MAPTMLGKLCKRIQHCCTTLRRSRNKRNVGSCWLKSLTGFKPRENGRNIVGQQLPTLLDVTFCVRLHTLLRVVAQSLKQVKLFSQQLPTFLLFRDRRSVAQQCWIRLHSSSNIVGATHAHYAWFTKTYGLYPSHDALQVPTLLGVVASVCSPLPTRTQQLPTLLAQQCWELLRPFARSLKLCATTRNNMQQGVQTDATCNIQQCWELLPNNVASVCTGPYVVFKCRKELNVDKL